MADINKIFIDSDLHIVETDSAIACFSDGKLLPRTGFSLVDNTLVLTNESASDVSFYINNLGILYEFQHLLEQDKDVIISGVDSFGKKLKGLDSKKTIMVFVDGVLLTKSQYNILNSEKLQILFNYSEKKISTIQIYISESLTYGGLVNIIDPDSRYVPIPYYKNRTLIFLNGEKVSFTDITESADNSACVISRNLNISDRLEYFILPSTTIARHFKTSIGFIEYSGRDFYDMEIPDISNYSLMFNDQINLLVDGVRDGFILKEVDGPGCAVFTGNTYETPTVKAFKINGFLKTTFNKNEYYLEVPEARSIVEYLSQYDKQLKLLPEVLNVLQDVILKEVYDEALRIKNLRNLSHVDSAFVNKFLNFLGFDMEIKSYPLRKRRQVLSELNNFFRVVGTRASYNFFNMIESGFGVRYLEQLFTYHKSTAENQREYIDFVTKQEAGAELHKEFRIPKLDYGYVARIPTTKPLDYGSVLNSEPFGEDYGFVKDAVKGKWYQWWTWDRPKNLYPTNHVKIELKMGIGADSEKTLEEFKYKFYNIASAVLYIHDVIQSYEIGESGTGSDPSSDRHNDWGTGDEGGVVLNPDNPALSHKIPSIGFMTGPTYVTQKYCVSHDLDFTQARYKVIEKNRR